MAASSEASQSARERRRPRDLQQVSGLTSGGLTKLFDRLEVAGIVQFAVECTDRELCAALDAAPGANDLISGPPRPAGLAAIRDAIGKDLTRVPVRPTDIVF